MPDILLFFPSANIDNELLCKCMSVNGVNGCGAESEDRGLFPEVSHRKVTRGHMLVNGQRTNISGQLWGHCGHQAGGRAGGELMDRLSRQD